MINKTVMQLDRITDAIRSDAIFLVLGVEFVAGKAGADDSTEKYRAFLFCNSNPSLFTQRIRFVWPESFTAQIESARIRVGRHASTGDEGVILTARPLKAVLPTVIFFVLSLSFVRHLFHHHVKKVYYRGNGSVGRWRSLRDTQLVLAFENFKIS